MLKKYLSVPDTNIRRLLTSKQHAMTNEISMKQIEIETSKDNVLIQIMKAVNMKHSFFPKDRAFDFFREKLEYMSIIDGVLVMNELIILSASLIHKLITILHEGNSSASSMVKLIQSLYIFKNINKYVHEFVSYCLSCQANVDTTTYEPNILTTLPRKSRRMVRHRFHKSNSWKRLHVSIHL